MFLFSFFSYKENDSAQETDSDDIVEVAFEEKEEDNSEAIEKIMDHRVILYVYILLVLYDGMSAL